MNENEKIWQAALYVRLSKGEDANDGIDSIVNQKAIIKEHANTLPNVEIVAEMVDNGFSGVNYERPSFIRMMDEIKAGRINCVIVKDLSRFGRNFIETGKYLEQIFPFLGVRFLSVNDRLDSMSNASFGYKLIAPFRNLINDAYCYDLSMKIRSQLENKRRKGDFIGAFAAYGYLKDEKNHNKLVVDDYAADIVRLIFKYKIEGMSNQGIADRMNEAHILSPMEYKLSIGLNYATPFKTQNQAIWSALSIGRILKDEVYTGVLSQGKCSVPNYKVKKTFRKPKEDWIRIPDTHKAIVSKEIFMLVESLLNMDTRISPTEETVYLFSGIIKCADCGGSMVRKTVPTSSGSKKYFYYVCKNSKLKKCSTHNISENTLKDSVSDALRVQIQNIIDIENDLFFINTLPLKLDVIKRMDNRFLKLHEEIKYYEGLKKCAYEYSVKDYPRREPKGTRKEDP